MRTALLLLIAAGQGTQEAAPTNPELAVYTSYETRITFNHPKSWIAETKKGRTKILIPLEGSTEQAVLELHSAQFNSEIDIWQATQKHINEQMRREVVNQWQEEILGVPFLLTKSQAQEKGVTMVTVSGLMYSATPRKFTFRLTASAGEFEKADYAFRTALQSVRTVDGTLPKPEDPDRTLSTEDVNPLTKPPKTTTWTVPKRDPATYVKGPVTAEGEAGGKKLIIRAPQGWTIEKDEVGNYILKHPEVSGTGTLKLFSTLDSESMYRALLRASGRSLEGFAPGAKRDEKQPYESASGTQVAYVWRTGTVESKSAATLDAVGQIGEAYWLLTWKSAAPDAIAKNKLTLMTLLDVLSLEAAP